MKKVPFPSNVPPVTKDYNVLFLTFLATAIVNELSYKNKILKSREHRNAYTITETKTEQPNLLSIIGRLIKMLD